MTNTVFVFIDIQREYIVPERPFYLKGIESSLAHCRALLEAARDTGCKIIHVQHLKAGSAIFSPGSIFSEFVPGFEPKKGELLVRKSLYSCYTSSCFIDLMEQHKRDSVYLLGYNTIMCCLSTLVEGYHRGHRLSLVEDASYAKATAEYNESTMHAHTISLIRQAGYGAVIGSDDLRSQMSTGKLA